MSTEGGEEEQNEEGENEWEENEWEENDEEENDEEENEELQLRKLRGVSGPSFPHRHIVRLNCPVLPPGLLCREDQTCRQPHHCHQSATNKMMRE